MKPNISIDSERHFCFAEANLLSPYRYLYTTVKKGLSYDCYFTVHLWQQNFSVDSAVYSKSTKIC